MGLVFVEMLSVRLPTSGGLRRFWVEGVRRETCAETVENLFWVFRVRIRVRVRISGPISHVNFPREDGPRLSGR